MPAWVSVSVSSTGGSEPPIPSSDAVVSSWGGKRYDRSSPGFASPGSTKSNQVMRPRASARKLSDAPPSPRVAVITPTLGSRPPPLPGNGLEPNRERRVRPVRSPIEPHPDQQDADEHLLAPRRVPARIDVAEHQGPAFGRAKPGMRLDPMRIGVRALALKPYLGIARVDDGLAGHRRPRAKTRGQHSRYDHRRKRRPSSVHGTTAPSPRCSASSRSTARTSRATNAGGSAFRTTKQPRSSNCRRSSAVRRRRRQAVSMGAV